MNPQDAWNAAYNQLELQLDRASFDTWLRPAVFLHLDDGAYVIGVHNSYAQDMLQHRLYRNVHNVLSSICGHTIEIRFVVHKAAPKRAESDNFSNSDEAPLFRFLSQRTGTADLPETSESQKPSSNLHDYVSQPSRPELPECELNPRLVFNRFVVNKSNQMVYEAALAVADYPSTIYNPFFVYGGVGLGKTHLLQSIAHVCREKGLRTIYLPSEVFTNDLVNAIRNRSTAMFRDKYRSVDVLLVDDVQFIGGKDTTQEEFFHTFNALANFNKQIILASDRHPREMKTLEDRLQSRFQGGLVTDIQPPEYETRVAILQMWANEYGATLPDDVLQLVAQRDLSNVRDLKGAFNRILAQTHTGNANLSLAKAESTLNRYQEPRERVTLKGIIALTAQNLGLSYNDLISKRRTGRINRARQVAMYLSREMTEYSLPQIGEAFGRRSHTTVLHGANKIAEAIECDKVLEAKVLKIRQQIARKR